MKSKIMLAVKPWNGAAYISAMQQSIRCVEIEMVVVQTVVVMFYGRDKAYVGLSVIAPTLSLMVSVL